MSHQIDSDHMIKRIEQERASILNINRLVLSQMNYRDFCDVLCLELRKVINFDYFSLISRTETTGEYYAYSFNLEQDICNFYRSTELKTDLEKFLYNEAIKANKIIMRNGLAKNENDVDKYLQDCDITSYMVYPLFINNVLIGCINILSKNGT